MKILYAIEGLGSGGTERSLCELLPRLRFAGIEAEVVCLKRSEGYREEVVRSGFPVHELRSSGWLGRIAELRDRIRRYEPEILHTMLFRTDLIGRIAAAGTGVVVLGSLVSTPYDRVRYQDPDLPSWRLRRAQFLDSVTARWLGGSFHAVSHATKASAVRDLGLSPERISVVERGRDSERLGRRSASRRLAARMHLGLSDDDEVLVNVGRHVYPKAQLDLLSAFGTLARKRTRVKLLIAGREGALTRDLQEAVRAADLGGRVRLLGHRDDVPEILSAADVFVFPSVYEGLPGAVLEAMALELPVVASDIPPVREVVEPDQSALLVPTRSPRLLADAIARVLDSPERATSLGRRGRKIFEERFTLERSVRGLLSLYESLVVGRDHRAPTQKP